MKEKIYYLVVKFRSVFNNKGNAFVDLAIKVGISVVIGSVVIGIFNEQVGGIFESLFTEIKNLLNLEG